VSAISIVKYIYIFVLKNPSGQNDDFWCFFVNFLFALLAGLSQVAFQFLPGRNPYIFYVCSGQMSDPSMPAKMNFPLQGSFLLTVVIYSVVLVKIKLYNIKVLRSAVVAPTTGNNCLVPAKVGPHMKNTLANFVTLACILITVGPVVGISSVLNGVSPDKLGSDPYYQWVQFHQHICPFLCTGLLTASYYISNRKMRETIYREVKELLLHCFHHGPL
jgi:hypothetical protein